VSPSSFANIRYPLYKHAADMPSPTGDSGIGHEIGTPLKHVHDSQILNIAEVTGVSVNG
jgi:hypothetical protein